VFGKIPLNACYIFTADSKEGTGFHWECLLAARCLATLFEVFVCKLVIVMNIFEILFT